VDANTSLLDVGALRQIVEMLEASDITRLQWRRGDERLVIQRGHAPVQPVFQTAPPSVTASYAPAPSIGHAAPQARTAETAPASPVAPAVVEKPGTVVTSPFVGTFYRTPAPDQPSFVEVGASVRKGQVICIIEAMKLMNEIESDFAGKVSEILVQNGQPVEFGQPLFRIEQA
jgi:acetyl-CoA carboxylase biotin carboxyl carrier protein